MSVSTETDYIYYAGNGSTVTPYAIPFPFLDTGHIEVQKSDDADGPYVTLSMASYAITRLPDGSGGSVVTNAAVVAPAQLLIYRKMPRTQPTTFQLAGPFPSRAVETALDRFAMQLQELYRLLFTDFAGPLPLPWRDFSAVAKWSNDAGRAVAVPDYVGQLGVQLDTKRIYVATGMLAGNWSPPDTDALALANGNILIGSSLGVATPVPVSGNATLSNTGVLTIANAAITAAKLAVGAAAGNLPSGAVLQTVYATNASYLTTTAAIPFDNSVPQKSEGLQILAATITPSSSTSKIRVRVNLPVVGTTASITAATLFRGSNTSAIAVAIASWGTGINMVSTDSPGVDTPIAYTVNFGVTSGSPINAYLNGDGSSRIYGGAATATIVLEEIKA